MLWKKRSGFKGNILLSAGLMLMICLVGCSSFMRNDPENTKGQQKQQQSQNADKGTMKRTKSEEKALEEILESCCEVYKEAAKKDQLGDLEMLRNLVNKLGESGYTAIDSDNQINMTEYEKLLRFCEAKEKGKEGRITVVEVVKQGSCIIRTMETQNKTVNMIRSYYVFEKNKLKLSSEDIYQADEWAYTDDGYLLFSGPLSLEETYEITRNEIMEYKGYRILPLDETCREFNRRYILPVGYKCNNMFLTDWNEDDFGELDFYDMFDIFHSKPGREPLYYTMEDHRKTCAVYMIPKEEFEQVIMSRFKITSEVLQSKSVYHPEEKVYEYKPRGFEETEYPEYPYPEVVGYIENPDSTLTLKVHAVFPYRGLSKAYVHEVTVRDTEDGGIQYVGNRILEPINNQEIAWHTPRLTRDEWEELYGGKGDAAESTATESAYWLVPQAEECLISDEEKEELQKNALSAATLVGNIYKETVIPEEQRNVIGGIRFPDEQRKNVVEQLGNAGFVAVEENTNMQNYAKIEQFYADYQNGQDSMITIYDVHRDGVIGAVTFVYREAKLQTYYIGIQWKEEGIPKIEGTSVSDVAEIKLTEKGYFIYAYENVIAHASLRQYWRIKPLSEECRELTRKYLSGLSYVNYNVLVTNWDSSNVEDILMPCMFEDIYRIATGEILKAENGQIPAEEYEKIMTTYFPVSVEQVREHCGYDANSNSYPYEMIYARPYPPFGEVVDYKYHDDGTITLIVDGVWADYNSDFAFQNVIVVQPFEDGTFRYLSNAIEEKELELPLAVRMEG